MHCMIWLLKLGQGFQLDGSWCKGEHVEFFNTVEPRCKLKAPLDGGAVGLRLAAAALNCLRLLMDHGSRGPMEYGLEVSIR